MSQRSIHFKQVMATDGVILPPGHIVAAEASANAPE